MKSQSTIEREIRRLKAVDTMTEHSHDAEQFLGGMRFALDWVAGRMERRPSTQVNWGVSFDRHSELGR